MQGASANALPGALPVEVREERRARFMEVQAKISTRRLKRKVGQTLTVLIDETANGRAVGRSTADAPEIDGSVHIRKPGHSKPGDFVKAHVYRADAHDLYGDVVA